MTLQLAEQGEVDAVAILEAMDASRSLFLREIALSRGLFQLLQLKAQLEELEELVLFHDKNLPIMALSSLIGLMRFQINTTEDFQLPV